MKVKLLLSTQRSGSHFLKSLVETHFSDVICSGEMLEQPIAGANQFPILASHPDFPHFWTWYEREAAAGTISVAPDKKIAAFERYLAQAFELVAPKDLIIDTKYNSIRTLSGYWDTDYGSRDYVSFITDREIPVLHLIRKNLLRVVLSNKLAQHTGVWHRTHERSPEEQLPKLRLNPKGVLFEIRYAFKLAQDYQNRFSGYPGYDEIIYEDLVREQGFSEPGINMRSLALFLDKPVIAPSRTPLRFKKTTPEDPAEVVENWQEVVRLVRTTEHGWMTDSPLLAAA